MTAQEARAWCVQHLGARVVTNASYSGSLHDRAVVGTITCLHDSYFCVQAGDGTGGGCNKASRSSFGTFHLYPGAYIRIDNTRTHTTMSRITDFFKEIGATKEEKLLKKYCIEDPIGTPTAEGLDLMARILYKENREKVIAIAKQLDEEEKEKKG